MLLSTSAATKTVSALIALVVIVSVLTVGGVAQINLQHTDTANDNTEPNNSMVNSTPIRYGHEINATLSSPTDVDYYAVNVTAGDSIIPRLHLKNMFEESAIQVDIVAPTGEVTTELTNDQNTGPQNTAGIETLGKADTAHTGDVMESDGTYYVRVMEANRTYSGSVQTNDSATYRYNLTVNSKTLDQYEPNENGTTATSLGLDETVNATFAGYDSDVYAVNLTAGQPYTITSRSPDGRYSYAPLGIMRVYKNQSQPVDDPNNGSAYHFDPNGPTVATSTTIHGETESVVFRPPTNATYYVQIAQDPENGNLLEPAPYELTVTETGPNNDLVNATPIEYGQDMTTTLVDGEEDWYMVDGRAGLGLLADISHLEPVRDGSLQVDVLTANGEVMTEFSTSGEDSPNVVSTDPNTYTLAHAADVMESNDTYYVRVSESPANKTNTSTIYEYLLNAEIDELDRYDPNENGITATPIAVNETTQAVFIGYDSDVYAVNTTAGQTYTVNVGVESPQRNFEIQLAVYDDATDAVDDPASMANGTPVAYTAGLSYAEHLTFTAAENGTYYVQLVQSNARPSLFRWTNYTITVTGNRTAPDTDGEQPPGNSDSNSDTDADGLSDKRERELGTNLRAADTDGDGLSDRREVVELGTAPLRRDTDDDGLTDDCELLNEMGPLTPDSDGDGTPDGREI